MKKCLIAGAALAVVSVSPATADWDSNRQPNPNAYVQTDSMPRALRYDTVRFAPVGPADSEDVTAEQGLSFRLAKNDSAEAGAFDISQSGTLSDTSRIIKGLTGKAGAFYLGGKHDSAAFRWPGRLFIGDSSSHNGKGSVKAQGSSGWLQTDDEGDNVFVGPGSRLQWFETYAQLVSSIDGELAGGDGAIAVSGAAKTGDNFALGVAGVARQDANSKGKNAWGIYGEGVVAPGASGGTWAAEFGIMNFNADAVWGAITPYAAGYSGHSKGVMVNAGGGNSNAKRADVAFQVRGTYGKGKTKGAQFNWGLLFGATSLYKVSSDGKSPAVGHAIGLSSTDAITWSDATGINTELYASNAGTVVLNRLGTRAPYFFDFRKDGRTVGSIKNGGSGTIYNTTSDARLKENIKPASDAGEIIDAIAVREFDFKAGDHVRWGVIAQELNQHLPEVVSAGNEGALTGAAEDVWQVDYSKMVPVLLMEIQSLRARVSELEAAQEKPN